MKEEAKRLVERFDLPTGLMSSERKQCAKIHCELMIESVGRFDPTSANELLDHYEQLLKEIDKL